MCCLEMVRHMFNGEHLLHKIVDNRGNTKDDILLWRNKQAKSTAANGLTLFVLTGINLNICLSHLNIAVP